MTGTALYLGIDPGLAETGLAALGVEAGQPKLVGARSISTAADTDLPLRLAEIRDGVSGFLDKHQPTTVGIEEVFSHTRFPRSSIILAHARGAIMAALGEFGAPVEEISARRLKQAVTGSGKADKTQVRRLVERQLNLPSSPPDEHIADATAIALYLFIQSTRKVSR
ncbi:MAG: crossover junction endodeoxyribonuclease RuvC [bacterium]|nr:crossover junction endodeoxyribonuclease RuvC [bacterium]